LGSWFPDPSTRLTASLVEKPPRIKTERSVRTASSEQVRRHFYKEGIEQWRHFEPWLGALKEALGEGSNA